jgi:hypothetical protein
MARDNGLSWPPPLLVLSATPEWFKASYQGKSSIKEHDTCSTTSYQIHHIRLQRPAVQYVSSEEQANHHTING